MRINFSKIKAFADLIRLQSQTGTVLLMMPILWSLVIAANGQPPMRFVVVFVLGAFLMRSAGCVINDVFDSDIDQKVARTQRRPLPSGRLSRIEALLFFSFLISCAMTLLIFLNLLTVILSVGAVILAVLYPFSKRIIPIPQAVLGIAFGWGSIMAWAAVKDTVELPAVLIFLATVCWAIGYDTIYAIQDKNDDRLIGVGSAALYFGKRAWLAIAIVFSGMMLCLIFVGILQDLSHWFFISLIIVYIVMAIQSYMVKRGISCEEAFDMFRSHAWIGLVVFLGCLVGIK